MIRSVRIIMMLVATACALLLLSGCGSSPDEVVKKYAAGESKFIDIDGLKVHYRDEGTGPVLLCLHGIQSSLHTWDGWVKALKNKYRVIRIDLPGWGFTGPSNFGYNRDKTIQFLKKFIDAKGIKKLSLAGNSYGGFLSWNFAVTYPSSVEKLILIDAGGYPCKFPLPVIILTTPIIRDVTTLITPKFIVANFVRDVYGTKSRVTQETIDRYYDLMMYDGNRKESVKFLQEARRQLETEPVGVDTIKVPTLIMWGKQDTWIPLDVMERFKKDIPHARVIVYDGVGHIPMEEIPEITAKDADAFLSGRSAQVGDNQLNLKNDKEIKKSVQKKGIIGGAAIKKESEKTAGESSKNVQYKKYDASGSSNKDEPKKRAGKKDLEISKKDSVVSDTNKGRKPGGLLVKPRVDVPDVK